MDFLQVTEYSVCGIPLVSYARARKAIERRAKGPWVKAILVVLFWALSSWQWPLLWLFFSLLRSYQSWSNQLTYDNDPDIIQTSRPKTPETSLPKGSIRWAKGEYWPCKRVVGQGTDQYYQELLQGHIDLVTNIANAMCFSHTWSSHCFSI